MGAAAGVTSGPGAVAFLVRPARVVIKTVSDNIPVQINGGRDPAAVMGVQYNDVIKARTSQRTGGGGAHRQPWTHPGVNVQ